MFDSFAEFGIPDILVTDIGPPFTSAEFQSFLSNQGVRFHRRIALYHPSTNGQAERYVQSVKQALRAMNATPKTLRLCLNKFLMHYHRAPHQTTKVPPSSLFLNRIIRTKLDIISPLSESHLSPTEENLEERSSSIDLKNPSVSSQASPKGSLRSFQAGDTVLFRTYNSKIKWLKGTIAVKLGKLHYYVDHQGTQHKRHIDQLLPFHSNSTSSVQPRRIRFLDEIQVVTQESPRDSLLQGDCYVAVGSVYE